MKRLSLACVTRAIWLFRPASGVAELREPIVSDFLQECVLTNPATASTPLITAGVTNTLPLNQFVFPTNLFAMATNGSTLLFFGTNRVLSLPTAGSPARGVWKTEPFACIVLVPGPHPDDRMAVNPGKAETKMPVIKPSLKFVPLE